MAVSASGNKAEPGFAQELVKRDAKEGVKAAKNRKGRGNPKDQDGTYGRTIREV